MKLDLLKHLTQEQPLWKAKRADRVSIEKMFEDYTGLIRIMETHIPYPEWCYVEKCIQEDKKYRGKRIFVSGGDSINLDMFSNFYKTSTQVSDPSEEIATLMKFLKVVSKIYDKIIFMKTNHEKRIDKICSKISEDKVLAKALAGRMVTLEQEFEKNKIDNIVVVNDFMFQIGDVMITHIKSNSGVPGATSRKILQYLAPRIQKKWNVCFQLHTHTQSKLPIDRKLMIETGAVIDSLDYWNNDKAHGTGKLSTIGSGICEMRKGIADQNKCDFNIHKWQEYI